MINTIARRGWIVESREGLFRITSYKHNLLLQVPYVRLILLLVFLWGIALQEKAIEAIAQMRRIAIYEPGPSLRLGGLVASLALGDFRAANGAGGSALVVTLACLAIGLWRLWTTRKAQAEGGEGGWWSALLALTGIVVVQCLLRQFVIPTSGWNRVLMAVPFALLCAAAGLSYCQNHGQMLARAGLGLPPSCRSRRWVFI